MSGNAREVADVARLLAERRPKSGVFIVGVTGSVACGKTTFAAALADAMRALSPPLAVEVVCTDGFLFANATLEERGLLGRKGFPESYDVCALATVLARIRTGPVAAPGYSHRTYDLDRALERSIMPPDILIVEGLSLAAVRKSLDLFIYLDADEEHVEAWFVARFRGLCDAAKADPRSFYARFAALQPEDARAMAVAVWREINLPNLRAHIAPARGRADLVIRKGADHRIRDVLHPGARLGGDEPRMNGAR